MQSLKDKATSVVTGDAYDKPAKTKDGAMTTQDSDNAHTIKGTSADPNAPEPGKSKLEEKGEQMANSAASKVDKAQDKASSATQKAQNEAQKSETGQKAMGKAEEGADKAQGKAQESDAGPKETGKAQELGDIAKGKAQEGQGKA